MFRDRELLLREFETNFQKLAKRRGANAMYHEIVSLLYNPKVPMELQIKALQDLCYKYLEKRAPKLLGYGRMHFEKGHLHMHLMLSANQLNQSKRYFLYKKQFHEVKLECERYLLSNYPSLEQPVIFDLDLKKEFTQRERISQTLQNLFGQCDSINLDAVLSEYGFEVYTRGNHSGVMYKGKKYRFSTLGLEDSYQKIVQSPVPSKEEKRLQQLQQIRQYHQSVEKEMDSPKY